MNKIQKKDKIIGCFLGVAIGDSLGKPVESMTAEAIAKMHGRIVDYQDCSSHKYFENDDKGTTTDDYQLTKAIARAMITTSKFDLDEIAKEHVKEYLISVRGWGGSTREAIARIANGVHWKDAGKTEIKNRGLGNGVCMKAAPAGLYIGLTQSKHTITPWDEYVQNIADMAIMTHQTSIAVTSGLAHAFAILECFKTEPKDFSKKSFIKEIITAAKIGRKFCPGTIADDIQTRFEMLKNKYSPEEIIKEFNGSCYVYDSLPFTYAFFLRDPNSIESLFDCVNSGGDTDSNCSMLASLLGALHGTSIFPQYLIDGLKNKDEVIDLANQFYEKFGDSNE
jgi:ADP-ribosyl-[dinitrogen reductase] hydrolase